MGGIASFFLFRGILTTNSGWREQIEKQIGEHEVILSDLECRQVSYHLSQNFHKYICTCLL